MHIISRKKLREFAKAHKEAERPLDDWYRKLSRLEPENFVELQSTFPHLDLVGKCCVFNVGGNKYRIIAKIYFEQQTLLVRYVLTHKEYDEDRWKADCKK